jgi:hypothetical protein
MTSRLDETTDIMLAGEKHSIRQPTLDELQELMPFAETMARAPSMTEKIKAVRALIAAATGVKDDALGKLPITPVELLDAADAILRLAGLEALKNRKPAGTA